MVGMSNETLGDKADKIRLKSILKRRLGKCLVVVWILLIGVSGYCLTVFTDVPILSDMRNIWVETAMTSGEHQWLATYFIPQYVIDDIMERGYKDTSDVSITYIEKEIVRDDSSMTTKSFNTDRRATVIKSSDKLDQNKIGETDEFGNKVLVNDIEQGILIVEVKGISYTGQLVFIDDPSRIFVDNTSNKGVQGELILDYLDTNNVILGINANGFLDTNGVGNGGTIIGRSISHGVEWGNDPVGENTTIGFDKDNRLIVGKIDDWSVYKLRDAVQFKPVIISNGKEMVEGSDGWGVQPRTVVGQREDGTVLFLVVDGRKPGHSIGITVGECAKILKQYRVVNAAACDGGSSSTLAYNGSIINKPSTPMETGRYLPNALLVKRKDK